MGPVKVENMGGKKYMISLIHDFTRYAEVNFLFMKSDASRVHQTFCEKINTQTNPYSWSFRSDQGGKYINAELTDYFESKGIQYLITTAYSPECYEPLPERGWRDWRWRQESCRVHQEERHSASGASGASGTSGASWSTWSSPEADRKQPEANYSKSNFHEAPEAPEPPEANFFLPHIVARVSRQRGTKTRVVRESSRSGYKGTGRDPLRRGRDKRLGRNQSWGFEGRRAGRFELQ